MELLNREVLHQFMQATNLGEEGPDLVSFGLRVKHLLLVFAANHAEECLVSLTPVKAKLTGDNSLVLPTGLQASSFAHLVVTSEFSDLVLSIFNFVGELGTCRLLLDWFALELCTRVATFDLGYITLL